LVDPPNCLVTGSHCIFVFRALAVMALLTLVPYLVAMGGAVVGPISAWMGWVELAGWLLCPASKRSLALAQKVQ
jgi:hypothetical protein